jgi:hypothetical protein
MHLTADEALDLIEGQARESQVTFWTSHMVACDDCREQLKAWKQLHTSLTGSQLESAPQNLIHAAEALFEVKPQATRPTLRAIIASIVFDSLSQPALAGARGSASTRQIVLRAEEYDIHLRIWGESQKRRMTGQLLARGGGSFIEGANLYLLRNGERLGSASIDTYGEFEFSGVPEGSLSLQADLRHLTIVGAFKVN